MNKSYMYSIRILTVLPIVVVLISFKSLPLLYVIDQNSYSNFGDYLITNIQFLPFNAQAMLSQYISAIVPTYNLLNSKIFSILIAVSPLLYYVYFTEKLINVEENEKRLLYFFTISTLLYINVTLFILYLNIYQIIAVGFLLIHAMLAMYLAIYGVFIRLLKFNSVVGFRNKYTINTVTYARTNNIFAFFLIVLAFIEFLIPVITNSYLVSIVINILFLTIVFNLVSRYSKEIYRKYNV